MLAAPPTFQEAASAPVLSGLAAIATQGKAPPTPAPPPPHPSARLLQELKARGTGAAGKGRAATTRPPVPGPAALPGGSAAQADAALLTPPALPHNLCTHPQAPTMQAGAPAADAAGADGSVGLLRTGWDALGEGGGGSVGEKGGSVGHKRGRKEVECVAAQYLTLVCQQVCRQLFQQVRQQLCLQGGQQLWMQAWQQAGWAPITNHHCSFPTEAS